MRGGHDGNRLLRDIDAQFQAAPINIGKVLLQEIGRLVGDIEINAIQPAFFHFKVDRTGDDVARRKFRTFIVPEHEARTIRELQQSAFAAYRFADQERFGMGMIKAGRMKLDEFHVCDAATRAPAHGDAIAGRGIGIGGVKINLAGAAGRQHGVMRANGADPCPPRCPAHRRHSSGCPSHRCERRGGPIWRW